MGDALRDRMAEYTLRADAPPYSITVAEQAAATTAEDDTMYGKFPAGNAQPHFKRSHKKSRTGCVTCKQRRVKVSGAPPTR